MSVYFVEKKGWRYDFTLKGARYTEAWFKTKKETLAAEAKKKEALKTPVSTQRISTDMGFFELVEKRLDHVKAYNSENHYKDYCYMARKWIKRWGRLYCNDIASAMLEEFILERRKVSAFTANKEIRYLRATFNFGKKKKLIAHNPADDLDFLPEDKKIKYVPPIKNVEKVIQQADPDTQDYLITISDTMGRVGEINRLCWDDVNLNAAKPFVILYTRKKKGGHLTPRKIHMASRLLDVLTRRFANRDPKKPWVFWHRYFDRKDKVWKEAPYKDRKRIMKTLCKKADVPYFRFHALRHASASLMDNNHVQIGSIQRILGHENRTTTEIYLHNLGDSEIEAIETLERAREFSHTDSHTVKKST